MIRLNQRVADIFDRVRTEEELKSRTVRYLCREIAAGRNGKRLYRWRPVAACAVFLVCVLAGGLGGSVYFTPSAYIDLDVNPSVELTVNRMGRVIAADAYNGDGEELLAGVSVRHAEYNKAVERLLAQMDSAGYFSPDTLLSVTVQTNGSKTENRMLENLQETIDRCREQHHYDTITDVFAVTEEVKHCAHEKQVSPAKYLAIQELLAVDEDADFESCARHSVHELQQLARQRCGGTEDESSSGGHGHGNGHHH